MTIYQMASNDIEMVRTVLAEKCRAQMNEIQKRLRYLEDTGIPIVPQLHLTQEDFLYLELPIEPAPNPHEPGNSVQCTFRLFAEHGEAIFFIYTQEHNYLRHQESVGGSYINDGPFTLQGWLKIQNTLGAILADLKTVAPTVR